MQRSGQKADAAPGASLAAIILRDQALDRVENHRKLFVISLFKRVDAARDSGVERIGIKSFLLGFVMLVVYGGVAVVLAAGLLAPRVWPAAVSLVRLGEGLREAALRKGAPRRTATAGGSR